MNIIEKTSSIHSTLQKQDSEKFHDAVDVLKDSITLDDKVSRTNLHEEGTTGNPDKAILKNNDVKEAKVLDQDISETHNANYYPSNKVRRESSFDTVIIILYLLA